MKVVSFNINSIRARLHQLQALIDVHSPDVIGLQETKAQDEDFPIAAVESMGYHAIVHGQKTHYGVAMLSREPMTQVKKGFDSDTDDAQRRIIEAQCVSSSGKKYTVINGYFPQGESNEHPLKYPAKRKFYENLNARLHAEPAGSDPLLVIGDVNVAFEDRDIGIGADNAKRWLRTGKCSFLPEEREWLEKIIDCNLFDTYRHCHPNVDDRFSWFDYRSKGFDREPKRGMRIDLILASPELKDKLIDVGIDYDLRAIEKPSDHCPIWATFDS